MSIELGAEMSEDDTRTPARKRFDDIVMAVEVEKGRCVRRLRRLEGSAQCAAGFISRREAIEAILAPSPNSEPKPEPPAPEPAPPSEPMTIATMLGKLNKGSDAYWDTVRDDLQALVQAARDKGFKEGKSEQLADEAPPAPEPMTVERLMGILQSRHVANGFRDSDWPDVRAELTALVREQARRDAELAAKCPLMTGVAISREILKAAGLQ